MNEFRTRATRTDVAKMAGVSVATVSHVFNNKRYVSEPLRKRVIDAAKQLNYSPDLIARSLSEKHTNTVAILLSDMANYYQIQVIKGMQKQAMEFGYFLYVCDGEMHIQEYLQDLISRRIDGVFLSVVPDSISDEQLELLAEYGIKIVANESWKSKSKKISTIFGDIETGIGEALLHLKNLGHKPDRIGYLSAYDTTWQYDFRLKFFLSQMKKLFDFDATGQVVFGKPPFPTNIETGYNMMNELLDRNPECTAVLCTNDMMAFGAINALRAKGLLVPEDVSVIGIDDIDMAKDYTPALTTISLDGYGYGREIFNILYKNINFDKPQESLYRSKLITRASTSSPREKIKF